MRVNQITIQYRDGFKITHYDINQIITSINDYNALNYPTTTMTLPKIRRYLLGKSNIPSPYKSITKTRLNEVLNINNLSTANYGQIFNDFVLVNSFSTRQLHTKPLSI